MSFWVSGDHKVDASCDIAGSGYVLVGGGAQLSSAGFGNPGALLTASYPDSPTRWKASSKDHAVPFAHSLRAWAIGMKLNGVSEASLQGQVQIVPQVSASSSSPAVSASAPPGFILVGGGARTTFGGAGLLLTNSSGSFPTGIWNAAAKDHGFADTGTVTAYAIGVKNCPTGYSGCLVSTAFTSTGAMGTGYQSATASAVSPWAMSSIGGTGVQSPPGRLLNTLEPQLNGQGRALVWTKDHQYFHNGNATAQVIAVKKQ